MSKRQRRVEFRGRLVADHYPERHAIAQRIHVYDDFADGAPRDRIRYGDPKDMNPGGITYATREERIEARIRHRHDALARLASEDVAGRSRVDKIFPHVDDPNDLVPPSEEIQTHHRCSSCDVDVGEFHLPGCDNENCPRCVGQALSCGCSRNEDNFRNDDKDAE